jgi:hypothetical protein
MLGDYTKGMVVKFQARFRNGETLIAVENVVVRVEHYDESLKQVIHDLPETPMKQLNLSDYQYDYVIPPNLKIGSYSVHMSARVPQNNNKVFDAMENFNVVAAKSNLIEENHDITITANELQPEAKIKYENRDQSNKDTKTLTDIVVNVENQRVKNVIVDVFFKNEYIPGDHNNVKIASTMTDEDGRWSVDLPTGEYVIIFKGIGFKENREFRKVL